ncbi:hypothetical protein C5167_033697 [Papaver somniferum]|uniref:Uncharacterized protein n=1 Tax=Papaver somniferum TaxID=3469 RepID=A0A4Y7KF46_PAPSO|nr:hypothetical protein C5167_033697 [Papaver somniferum]
MVLQLNEWVELILRNEMNCRWLVGQEATASVDDVAEQEIVMDSIASSQIFTMSFVVASAEGQSLADEYSRSAQYLAYFGGNQHGKLVDKENRPKEGLVTIGVTSGASTQDKKRCYEAGNLWMDWSITSCHGA